MEALVFAGGDPLDPRWVDALPRGAHVVAADSGLEQVHAHGLTAHLLVGDMDSVRTETREQAVQRGTVVEQHPTDKDATDLELALDAARALGATEVTVLGVGGGRLDHLLANLLLVTHAAYAELTIDARVDATRISVVRTARQLTGAVGSTVTLLPIGGPARGVSTTGLRWTLTDAELTPASTLGVSNEIVESPANILVREGVLLAIQPHGAP